MINKQIINEINQQINIVDIAKDYFSDLKKAGSVYQTKCKHGEDTPSLTFFPSTNTFYCFGCKAGEKNNSIVGFIEWMEECSEPQALKILKDKYNVSINIQMDPKLKDIVDIVELSKKRLRKNQSKIDYLKERGYNQDTIDKWNLGLNNDSILYPIANELGIYVGYALRLFNGSPKYINSKESDIFHKRKILFGFNHAISLIKKKNYIVLVEGYNDAIILQQYDIPAVALMGTSLTEDQISLIQKYNIKNIILFLDGDPAGISNTERIVNILRGYNIQSYVLNIFKLDPDEFANEYKSDTENLIKENMKPWYMYFFDKELDVYKNKLYKANVSLNQSIKDISEKLSEEEKVMFSSIYKKTLKEITELLL